MRLLLQITKFLYWEINSDVSFSGLQIKGKGSKRSFFGTFRWEGEQSGCKEPLSFGGPFDEIASGLTIDSDQIFISGSL